jgi:hypothetical protein
MPTIQELAAVPSFGQEFGTALGTGVSAGLQKSLETFQKGKAFEQAGLPRVLANLDPTIAAQLIKQQQKNALIQQIMGGTPQGSQGQSSMDELQQGVIPQEQNPLEPQRLETASAGDKNKQIQALALVDPNLARIMESQEKPIRTASINRGQKYLEKVEESRTANQRSRSALASAEAALAENNSKFFVRDNIANLTGIEALKSKEGAIFDAAAKQFFLSDLESAVGRPNQFLEKILTSAIFNTGKSREANEALLEFYKNQVDLDTKKIEISDDLEKFYMDKMGYVPGNIGSLVSAQLKPYAKEKEKELVNYFKSQKQIEEPLLKLPSAADNNGKIFKDTKTGKKYQSNGKNWSIVH